MKEAVSDILIRIGKFDPADQNQIILDVIRQLQDARTGEIIATRGRAESLNSALDKLNNYLK